MTDASAGPDFEPLPGYQEYPPAEMEARSERPIGIAIARPAEGARVALLRRKPLGEIATFR